MSIFFYFDFWDVLISFFITKNALSFNYIKYVNIIYVFSIMKVYQQKCIQVLIKSISSFLGVNKMKKLRKKAFTLIELLVVVLIIGILAAVAIPRYEESVERQIMQEAILNLRALDRAQDIFLLQNGREANTEEIIKLDVSIPGEIGTTALGDNRITTKYFIYSPGDDNGGTNRAVAHRLPLDNGNSSKYYLFINEEQELDCQFNSGSSNIQKKLCKLVQDQGHI